MATCKKVGALRCVRPACIEPQLCSWSSPGYAWRILVCARQQFCLCCRPPSSSPLTSADMSLPLDLLPPPLQGHALSSQSSEGRSEFTPLWDAVAVAAARAGSLAGYDGMRLEVGHRAGGLLGVRMQVASWHAKDGAGRRQGLRSEQLHSTAPQPCTAGSCPNMQHPPPCCPQVRSAGEDAWLCQAAPHVPELDGPEEEDSHGVVTTLPALPDRAGAGSAAGGSAGSSGSAAVAHSGALVARSAGHAAAAAVDPLVAWDYRQVAAAAAAARRRTSFRSVKEAVVRRRCRMGCAC